MDIHVIYEDQDMLAVSKPSGLMVHPDGKRDEYCLTDWVLERYPEIQGVGEPLVLPQGIVIDRPGIVHRLDKDTSGILILAKNQTAYLFFKKQFSNHTIKKEYRAILYGELKEREGKIDFPIGRSTKNFRLKTAGPKYAGKVREALTRYRVLSETSDYSYVAAFPETGRMHQLRAHFKALNHPIVCDPLYAPKRICPKSPGRLALHAFSIECVHPNGVNIKLEASLPTDFLEGLKTLKLD